MTGPTTSRPRTGPREALARRVRGARGAAPPLGWLVHRLERRRARLAGPDPGVIAAVIAAFAELNPEAVVVQVGANDGIKRDPLRRHLVTRPWRAFLLEPVPEVYEALQRNVRYLPGVTTVNVAISDAEGTRPFFQVRPPTDGEEIWGWYDALGSFDREVLLSHSAQIPDIADRIVETEVRTTTFSGFVAEHGITEVDLLHVDTEGYDLQVLEQVDFRALAPSLIIYEHHHLGPGDRRRARDLLAEAGYAMFEEGLDTAAIRARSDTPEAAAMRVRWDQLTGGEA